MKIIKYLTFLSLMYFFNFELRAQALFEIEPLSINTSYSNEAAAIPYGNGIIFCSNRNIHVLVSRTDINDEPLNHLYYTQKTDSNKWGTPQILEGDITTWSHQCPCSAGANGNELYYSADRNGIGIFIAQKNGNRWDNIRPFVHNRKNYKNVHPSLSSDGSRLFFASDMPGGYGGFDIYYCEWTPRGWGTPKNAGPEVNGPGNELYPSIHQDGTLYFSSEGHQSLGGLDIFSVREINGEWKMRFHLEAPINSEKNDFAFVPVDNQGNAYFTTDRKGNMDIYRVKSLFPEFISCNEQEENDYSYEFFEPGTVNIDTSSFRYVWDMGDGTEIAGQIAEHTFQKTGEYFIQLNVVDTITGEVSNRVASYLFEVLDIEQPYISINDTIEAGIENIFDAAGTFLPELEIEEYYWNFGDGTRKKGNLVNHTYTDPGVFRIQLGILGKSKQTGRQEKVCSYRDVYVVKKQ